VIFPTKKASGLCACICACATALFGETEPDVPAPANPDSATIETERFSTARTDFFEISAEDAQAATRAAELAGEVENYFLKHPRLWKKLLPPLGFRVHVELFRRSGIFALSKTENGRTRIFLSENLSTPAARESTRRNLAHAMIFQLSPAKNPADVPAWLVYAAAEESRIGSVPGRRIFLQKKSKFAPPVSPEKILSATASEFDNDEDLRLNALWFSRAIPELAPFFDKEKSAEEQLLAAFPQAFEGEKFDSASANKFWATRFRRLIAAAPSGIDLPEESQRVFDDALLVLVQKDGNETRLLAGDLIPFRLQPEIRETLAEQLSALSAHFRKVNPVWHNAFAEYGLFLEMFGNPDVDAGTLEAQWNKAVLARSDALALQRDIRAALENR